MSSETRNSVTDLRKLLDDRSPQFWESLWRATRESSGFDELFALAKLRRKALKAGAAPAVAPSGSARIAFVGATTMFPLEECVQHLLAASGMEATTFVGAFENHVAEIMDEKSALYAFAPKIVYLAPSERMLVGLGRSSQADAREEAASVVGQILDLCTRVHQRTGADVVLANYTLPGGHDPGPYRAKTLANAWTFRKLVNLELGLAAPGFVHICDLEFLSCRRGTVAARDRRGWYQSRQPGALDLVGDIAREIAHIVRSLRTASKKVLVADLDNTLWGGVIGDDGLAGIRLGDASPVEEAFKEFQKYLKNLSSRGVLLAVCSKNEHETAMEPFLKHPDTVLTMDDFVAFKANWRPKADNIREIADELGLGLDSFVFVDDNPAEIALVQQFAPEVTSILLGPDPAEFIGKLEDARLFEPLAVTNEDLERTKQYKQEGRRQILRASITDMAAYLRSLEMTATFSSFTPVDLPRVAQLINKSNQFNLTTRRRTEAELAKLNDDPSYVCLSTRLMDRFGDYGLIGVVIGRVDGATMEVDTWLMSCRVLERQVEDAVLNVFIDAAKARNVTTVRGVYIPTSRNMMVREFYPRLGFRSVGSDETKSVYELTVKEYQPHTTAIRVVAT